MARMRIDIVDRRDFVIGASAAAALGALLGLSGAAMAQAPKAEHAAPATPKWQESLKKIVGNATPAEAKVKLDLPEIAENGNTVPFTLSADSPMTDGDYIKAIHVLSTENPLPEVASFSFTPASGKAQVASRMRLARTQDIVAVAEGSDGKFYIARRTVKVTIGGCGG